MKLINGVTRNRKNTGRNVPRRKKLTGRAKYDPTLPDACKCDRQDKVYIPLLERSIRFEQELQSNTFAAMP